MSDEDVRSQIRHQLKARRSFWMTAVVFGIVAVFLAVVWYFSTGPGTYFWPVWAYLGMGIALVFMATTAWGSLNRKVTEADVDAELAKRQRRAGGGS